MDSALGGTAPHNSRESAGRAGLPVGLGKLTRCLGEGLTASRYRNAVARRRLAAVLQLVGEEALGEHAGRDRVSSRLGEVLLIEMPRPTPERRRHQVAARLG
jgi:hypothetical protein